MNHDPQLFPTDAPVITERAFHGGKSFEAIGVDFQSLERSAGVISADVLDAWFDPSPNVLRKLRDYLPFLSRSSPPVHGAGLVQTIAKARGIPGECVLVGGGSSDLIFTCFPHLIRGGEKVVILDPMYGEYRHIFERVIGAELVKFPLEEADRFAVEIDRLSAFAREVRPALIVLVNPNNPTGRFLQRSDVMRFLDSIPEETRVVVDETYVEYVGQSESVERDACSRTNLLVLKSMSKAYALSGLRVGYMAGSPELIHELARWMPPWAVSLPAQVAAVEGLNDPDYYQRRYCQTHVLRDALIDGLRSIEEVTMYPSVANFILLRVPESAQNIVESMQKADVFVRNCDSMSSRFQNRFVRIAVRQSNDNARILEAFAKALGRRV